MLRNVTTWIRQHPVRCVVYALLLGAGVWAGLTARGILRGERNTLLTTIARAPLLRDWVEREFHIRYSIDSVAVAPTCGFQVEVSGVNVDLDGAASGGLDTARVCVSGSGEVHGIRVGDKLITVDAVQFDWPKTITGSKFSWSDGQGEMVSAASFAASPNSLSGSLQNLRVLTIATVDSASATLAPLALPAITIQNAAARGIRADVDPTTLTQAPARLQAAANGLAAMGSAVLPLPGPWLATARKLVVQLLIAAAILLFILKVALTRAPRPIAWRIAAILAPFAAFPLIARTNSWLAIVIAAPVLAIALWALAYRHASEWQQRWEPAAIDIPVVLLALLLLVLHNWPVFSTPQIPTIDHVTLAQADAQDIAATVHQPTCGPSGTIHVVVPQAGLTNLQVVLAGSALQSIDMARASASGSVQTAALEDLRHLRYLPAQWKKTPPISFCAAVTLRNSGPANLPDVACVTIADVTARAAVDYTGQSARFTAEWNGAPAPVALSGSANLQGAQIDNLRTKPGAAVRIAKASARIAWPKAIAASVHVDGVEANGVAIDRLAVDAGAPMPCSTGPITASGTLGQTRYSWPGNNIQLDGATFAFSRPNTASVSATLHAGRLSLDGPVAVSIPASDLQFDGITSRESIPETLSAQATFGIAPVGLSGPVRLSANLWTGDWQVPQQTLTIRQQITSRIPPSLALEMELSGGIASVANPVQANARALVRIPQLVPDVGPAGIELNDLRVEGAWDAVTGLAPANISSGWNVVNLASFPSGFQLNEVSTLHVSTRGLASQAPTYTVPQIAIPTLPQQTKFRFQGTPRSIAITLASGEQVTLDQIETSNLKVAMPDLKLAGIDVDTSARVVRAHAAFPVAAHAHLTDASLDTVLTEPLGAKLSVGPQALDFALNQPLDTAKLLAETGFSLDGIQPQATLSGLQANVSFAGKELAGLNVSGTLAAGPLVTAGALAISQTAPSTFQVAAPSLPQMSVSASAPGVEVTLNGGQLRASAAAEVSLKMTLADAPASPLFSELGDAGTGLFHHAQKAAEVFGAEDAAAFPLGWDLEVTGGSPAVSLSAANLAISMRTLLHRVDIGQETIDGTVNLHAAARLAEGHLLLDLDAPADIGALGRRWQLNTPLLVMLRKELLPGTGGELFDSAFYSRLGGTDSYRLAIGYGDALQFHTTFQQPFTSGTIGGLAQAAIRWPNSGASIDSFGKFTFRGLEAGAIALPQAYLEDRLDGDIQFSTKGFLADRLLLPQLLADASRVRQLDTVDLSAQVRSAADGAHLPGILQAASGITLEPANRFIQLLTRDLNLTLPPRALEYQKMALDFRVQQGQVETEPVLLTLSGVQVFGVAGLTLDSKVRILWGGRAYEPAPLLRDLIYTLQRSVER